MMNKNYKHYKNYKEKHYNCVGLSLFFGDEEEFKIYKEFKEKIKKSEYRFLSNFFKYQIHKFVEETKK